MRLRFALDHAGKLLVMEGQIRPATLAPFCFQFDVAVVLKEPAAAGIRAPVVAHGAKHWQVRWQSPTGRSRMVTAPCTSSD